MKTTGAQHWDSVINVGILRCLKLTKQNYFLQLPPPYNTIIIGGAKPLTVKDPKSYVNNDREDIQFEGVPEFYQKWPKLDIKGWKGDDEKAPLEAAVEDGGVWSGGKSKSPATC